MGGGGGRANVQPWVRRICWIRSWASSSGVSSKKQTSNLRRAEKDGATRCGRWVSCEGDDIRVQAGGWMEFVGGEVLRRGELLHRRLGRMRPPRLLTNALTLGGSWAGSISPSFTFTSCKSTSPPTRHIPAYDRWLAGHPAYIGRSRWSLTCFHHGGPVLTPSLCSTILQRPVVKS